MEVSHAAIGVAAIDQSLAFYVDRLGLSVVREFENDGRRHTYVAGETGGSIQISSEDDYDPRPVGSTINHIAIDVDDLDSTLETATNHPGVSVLRGPDELLVDAERVSRFVFVNDPDGHAIEFVQRY